MLLFGIALAALSAHDSLLRRGPHHAYSLLDRDRNHRRQGCLHDARPRGFREGLSSVHPVNVAVNKVKSYFLTPLCYNG